MLRLRGFQALIAQSLWKDLSLPWPYFSCRFAGRKGSLQQLGTGVHALRYIRLGHVEADICREKRSNIVSISSSNSQMILIPFKVFESKAKPSNQHTLSFKLGQHMTWHSFGEWPCFKHVSVGCCDSGLSFEERLCSQVRKDRIACPAEPWLHRQEAYGN